MQAVIDGLSVRRAAWNPRRMVRLVTTPWNGETESLLVMDILKKGDVPPFPFNPKGEDVRGQDWEILT
jgi:hypothetical protein